MKKKVLLVLFIIICVLGLIYMICSNLVKNKNEEMINQYIPEVEISDTELRKTMVTLYFIDKDGNLFGENRIIDSKELLRNPYLTLVGMLIEGPKDENLKCIIPKDTKIINANINKKCVTVNLSKEFVENAERWCNGKV